MTSPLAEVDFGNRQQPCRGPWGLVAYALTLNNGLGPRTRIRTPKPLVKF